MCGFHPEWDPPSGDLQHQKKKKCPQELPCNLLPELEWTQKEQLEELLNFLDHLNYRNVSIN